MTKPPICNYEGSDYQQAFWEQGNRQYEDLAEGIAFQRTLPKSGKLMLEVGAGAGRNTPRYAGFERIVVMDYSTTQLAQAQTKLGRSAKYIYVAADVYSLPFRNQIFDAATMIRVLHHMADAPKALNQIKNVLQPNAVFILEFANKLNLKAILRYWLGKQNWNPFTLEPVEFVKLNFDFHPQAIQNWLSDLGFRIDRILTVSHFRLGVLKRLFPAKWLAALDGILQPSGRFFQLSPSVFVQAVMQSANSATPPPGAMLELFKCPDCGSENLIDQKEYLACSACKAEWPIQDGIYNFKEKR
ncbi:MAG: methyltransferase domain-containing protein [Anaerolineales bacterium]|nr:methyltransferase domain-containing protein [Anaerolineales bacterium]MCZ2120690.1 methyltransferase domain-containing protein [Anaerolineales bacterium]